MDPPSAKRPKIEASDNETINEVVKLESSNDELRGEIMKLREEVKEKESSIKELWGKVNETESSGIINLITGIQNQISEKEKQITEKEKQITEKQITGGPSSLLEYGKSLWFHLPPFSLWLQVRKGELTSSQMQCLPSCVSPALAGETTWYVHLIKITQIWHSFVLIIDISEVPRCNTLCASCIMEYPEAMPTWAGGWGHAIWTQYEVPHWGRGAGKFLNAALIYM